MSLCGWAASRAAGGLILIFEVKSPDLGSLTVLRHSGEAIRTLNFLFQLEELANCLYFDLRHSAWARGI
jgi:hypothetical protein